MEYTLLSYIAPRKIVEPVIKYGIRNQDSKGLICIDRRNRKAVKKRVKDLEGKGYDDIIEICFGPYVEAKEFKGETVIYPYNVTQRQLIFIYSYKDKDLIYQRPNQYLRRKFNR